MTEFNEGLHAYGDFDIELRNVRWRLSVYFIVKDGGHATPILWDLIHARWGVGGRHLGQHEIEAVLRTLDPGEMERAVETTMNRRHKT